MSYIDTMRITKVAKDYVVKGILGTAAVPRGLFELNQYFRHYKVINFKKHKEDDLIVAVSSDFQFGSIVTTGADENELDEKIKDAILTAFDIPSSYQKEAGIMRVGDKKDAYALV